MIQFALKTLLFDRGKLTIAMLGVVFSVVLMGMQGGLFLGLMSKASLLTESSEADLWVSRRGVENVDFANYLPIRWANRIRSLPSVAEAQPIIVGKTVATTSGGEYEDVCVIGEPPDSGIRFRWRYAQGDRQQAMAPESVSLDSLDAWKLGNPQVGDVIELGGRRARINAMTKGVLGFLVTPYLTTSMRSAQRYCSIPSHQCSYFVVKAGPGASLENIKRQIEAVLPEVEVMTSDGFGRLSMKYWMSRTGIGLSFGAATMLGLLVGLVMVAQSLYAMALDRTTDYATLKAMGAYPHEILQVLVTQALVIGLGGATIGVFITYTSVWLGSTPVTPIVTPAWLMAAGVVINLVICLVSVLLPLWRIQNVDAASVLQG